MAKKITVEFTDEEFASLQTAYSIDDADDTEARIKNAFINLVKSDMMEYDRRQAKQNVAYTPLDPQ